MKKAFLKYNRIGIIEESCLSFWVNLFEDYKIYVVCDLFELNKDSIPDNLKKITEKQDVTFLNSNYSLGNEYVPYVKARKRNMASANLTCFEHIQLEDKCFWIIDADDTHFLDYDIDVLKKKFASAEIYLEKENLDGFSLDFYRNYNDTWTFGVCLLSSSINWKQIRDIEASDLQRFSLSGNCDSVFDVLGRMNKLKLKNFVFDQTKFQHVYNNFRGLTDGIYFWSDNKLWDTPLKPDVIIL